MNNRKIATIAAVAAVVIIALVVYTQTIRDMTAQQIEHALDRRLIERACDAFSHPCDAEEIMRDYPEDVDSCILAFPDDHRLRGFCLDNAGASW